MQFTAADAHLLTLLLRTVQEARKSDQWDTDYPPIAEIATQKLSSSKRTRIGLDEMLIPNLRKGLTYLNVGRPARAMAISSSG